MEQFKKIDKDIKVYFVAAGRIARWASKKGKVLRRRRREALQRQHGTTDALQVTSEEVHPFSIGWKVEWLRYGCP